MLLLLLGLCALQFNLVQNFQADIQTVETVVDGHYITSCSFEPCDNEEMVIIIKGDCNIMNEMPENTTLSVTIKGMQNGEPTMPTGIDTELNICHLGNEEILIAPILEAMKVPTDECPPQARYLTLDCYELPMENMPVYFVSGEYQVVVAIKYGEIMILNIVAYVTVTNSLM